MIFMKIPLLPIFVKTHRYACQNDQNCRLCTKKQEKMQFYGFCNKIRGIEVCDFRASYLVTEAIKLHFLLFFSAKSTILIILTCISMGFDENWQKRNFHKNHESLNTR